MILHVVCTIDQFIMFAHFIYFTCFSRHIDGTFVVYFFHLQYLYKCVYISKLIIMHNLLNLLV